MWKLSFVLAKIVNQKCVILRGIIEVGATIKDLKGAEIVAPITCLFNSLFYPLQKPDILERGGGLP